MSEPTVLIVDSESAYYACELARAVPGPRYITAPNAAEAMPLAPDATVIVGLGPFLPSALFTAAPKLEWVHTLTTGVDNLLADTALTGLAITNSGGFHGPQMSELAILMMLSCARKFPRMLEHQNSATWERWKQPLLLDKTVCIVGVGAIAQTLAGLCNAFGMRVTGVSDGRTQVDGFAKIHKRAALTTAASQADFLVVLTPYSPATHHIINAEILAAMKPSAFLINISRGGCVDETALLETLRAKRIAGAALDVFATEPLPPSSPFWSQPNVIVTPHIGGFADIYAQQALPIVARHMTEWLHGGTAALTNRQDRT